MKSSKFDERYQIQSSNMIKRSTPYLLFCRVLLCCAAGRTVLYFVCDFRPQFWPRLLFCLPSFNRSSERIYLRVSRPHQYSSAQVTFSLAATITRALHSNFGNVGWSVLSRSSVNIWICPSKVASAVSMVHGASWTVAWWVAIILSTGRRHSVCWRGNFPAVLRRWVAPQHWVESLAQLIGALCSRVTSRATRSGLVMQSARQSRSYK